MVQNETTEAAVDKLVDKAKALGANGIVQLRLQPATTMNRFVFGLHATVVVYGTAVKLHPETGSITTDQAVTHAYESPHPRTAH